MWGHQPLVKYYCEWFILIKKDLYMTPSHIYKKIDQRQTNTNPKYLKFEMFSRYLCATKITRNIVLNFESVAFSILYFYRTRSYKHENISMKLTTILFEFIGLSVYICWEFLNRIWVYLAHEFLERLHRWYHFNHNNTTTNIPKTHKI